MSSYATSLSKDKAGKFDCMMMARAIALARLGEGRVEPNPMVGCVVVRRGRVLGEGYHRRFGGPHAEVEALRACAADPRGATVYVSLEPCCHHAKTPPCTDALIAAAVARVVVATRDPSPTVRGRGLRALRRAGIRVETGLLEREAAALVAPFATRVRLGRPYVIAKWAQSLDGQWAAPTGDPRWISCEASRRRVHRLRARVDAILVGSGTLLADNPMLTARHVAIRRAALRVVLDGRLRMKEDCQLAVTAANHPTLVLTTGQQAKSRRAERLRRSGVAVEACRSRRGRLQIGDALRGLARRNVTNLLVESGPTVLASLFEARLVDEAWVFVAPILIGGKDGPRFVNGRGGESFAAAPVVKTQRSGCDIFYRMRFPQRSEVPPE